MRLSELFPDIPAGFDRDVAGVTADSRDIAPGFIFAALKGSRSDGADFIPKAIAAGAIVVITDRPCSPEIRTKDCLILPVEAPRRELARIASLLYPAQPPFIAGVTGTNGKTSVVHFASQLWQALGLNAGSLGTLGALGALGLRVSPGAVAVPSTAVDDENMDAPLLNIEYTDTDTDTDTDISPSGRRYARALRHTTPDPVELHEILSEMATGGVTHLAMEVSSHGLDQCRTDYVHFSSAAFTNLTQDHLDYHQTFDQYCDAKARLFTSLLPAACTALINSTGAGADMFSALAAKAGKTVKTTGEGGNLLEISTLRPTATGLELTVLCEGKRYHIALPLIGKFQAENALLAAAIVIDSGYEAAMVLPHLAYLKGVPGRMALAGEVTFKSGLPASVLIDYAHTPDAIRAALAACRPHLETQGKLHIVFGAGGDRDATKRPLMGKAAHEGADFCIVTDDNPRTENPGAIRDAIRTTCPDALDIGDRAEAIKTAIARLGSGDILLIAGKGHETGQITAAGIVPFNDRTVAEKNLVTSAENARARKLTR